MPHSLQPFRIDVVNAQIRANIRALGTIRQCEPQPQMRPRISIPVRNLIILEARTGDDLLVMQRGARPDGVDAAGLVVLVPGPTLVLPDGVGDELLAVGVEEVGHGLLGRERADVLALHFADHLDGVVGDGAEGAHDGAVLDGPRRADEGEEVGEFGDREPEVGFWADFPFLGEVFAVHADDGEAGAVGDVEACGAAVRMGVGG